MDIKNMMSMLNGSSANNTEGTLPDSSEKIYISPLALIKMLKHSRAGVPMEVMGLMLGEFVDDYTVIVKDVFSMPQSGTSVTVESVDPVFQTNMLDMLKQTNRNEMVIGWYHSHPGFGCWLSSIDTNTQQSFESLNKRAVAVVVDPIQSVRGKVVIDAFRLINNNPMMPLQEFREHTSNEGFLRRPRIQALIHGLNKSYYSINIKYRKTKAQEEVMLSLYKDQADGLKLDNYSELTEKNEKSIKRMLELTERYNRQLDDDKIREKEKKEKIKVGVMDPKVHLNALLDELVSDNVNQTLGGIYDSQIF